MIKFLLTELGRVGRGNIWHSVIALRPYSITSGQIFTVRPSYSVNKYTIIDGVSKTRVRVRPGVRVKSEGKGKGVEG